MSEKQVNIKITANTKDFNNAIDKAQKQIESLAEVIDKLSSSKFGEKLEEQFDGLVKAVKKIEEQMTDMMDSLDDLGKAKFDKIEDQFKDIIDSGKDVNEKIEDILDLLDKVDRQDLNGLEKEFDQVYSSLKQLSTETRDSTDTMEKSFREITDEVGKFIKELNNVEDTKLENLEESIKDLDKYVDEAAESVSDFNKKTNELDNKEINDYIDSLKEVGVIGDEVKESLKKIFGAFDGKSGKLDFDLSGKGKDGGLMSTLTEGLVSGTVAGNKFEKTMEGVVDRLDDVIDNMKELDNVTDDSAKSIDDWGEEYKKAENTLEKLTKEYDDLIKKQKELNDNKLDMESRNNEYKKTIQPLIDKYKEIQEVMDGNRAKLDKRLQDEAEFAEQYAQGMEILKQKIPEVNNAIEEQKEIVDQVGKKYDEATDKVLEASDAIKKMENSIAALEMLGEPVSEYKNELESAKEFLEQLRKEEEVLADEWTKSQDRLEALNKELEEYNEHAKNLENGPKVMAELREESERAAKKLEELEKRAEGVAKEVKDLKNVDIAQDNELQKLKEEMQEAEKAAEGLQNQMKETADRMAEINKVAQGHAKEFDKQYKAYEKLSKEVKDYLENEENGILLREKVAKSFKQVADSMEAVYKDSSKLSNFDLVNKTLEEAAEHIKDLNLVSTDNLQADLNRLGEIIEDKTEKIKRFKELNKEFGSDASKAAAGLDKQAKDIRDWANSADFAIEAADKLTHAWGDLSAAGEDHLKIRERSKYIDDFGKALEENIAHIKNYYHELETLDDIYKECTDQQRAVIDDYRMWEKNKDALLEYNRAINEYMRTLRDSGGEIDTKFLDELGNFSPQKFIDNYEKMGASSIVLQKQINAVKIELLESIKAYKENAEAMKENAKAAVETAEENLRIAKSNKEAAESQEEYLEATEKVAKAQKELADAKNKLKNFDKDQLSTLRDQIKEYNRLAEAMREIGMAAKDIEKADISKFDKSLASALGRLDTFSNDIPKTFAALKEDITAVFSDMDSLDLGDALDGLKDIGASLFAAIPTELKVALGVATAIGVALKESAEMGIEHFSRGASTISNALSGIVGIARDIGQEIRDAFENITGMQLDFSSMMEIPVDFESMMAEVGAIAGATGEAFQELEDEARRLGATTRYSATEVAEAMKYMGMAGWDNTEIMAGLESVLNLATVANMDLGQASDFVTDGLTALGYEAKDAAKFVDILAKASTSSNTSVAQMQRAFTNCAPVAGTLGITMEDLSMALGLMADKGVKGAKAGTALKNLMANLSAPTEKQLAYIKQFNLEGAQQAIVTGDLIGGIKQMKAALSGLSPQQQNAIITTIAGKEALSGISALLNTTEEDLAELESAINSCDGAAQEMADNFDNTLKGALKGLASAMQETLLQVFDKTEKGIKDVTKELTEFFHILNGFSDFNGLKGLDGALAFLENASQGWGQAIADGLANAINSIDNFLNSKSFDNLLQVGTNIINGIADGIKRAADDGSLDSAISTAINKIATWFTENLNTIVDVGKEVIDAISKGISDNGDEIGEVIKAVMEMQTEIDKAVAKEKWKLIGENLVTFIVEGLQSKISVFFSGLTGFLQSGITEAFGFIAEWMVKGVGTLFFDPIQAIGISIGEWLRDAIIEKVQEAFNIDISDWGGWNWGNKKKDNKKSTSSKKSSAGKTPDTSSITSKSPIDIINSELSSGKVKTDTTAASIGQGISDNITKKLETMDAGELKALSVEMQNLQTTVTSLAAGMGASFTAIQDSARTSFMGLTNIVRNQLVSVTNIMRNQMVNSANIVRNQCLNMSNIFRNQFLSMANVARNQMLNVSNIIRNQAVNWANIIRNQVTNARNALTSQFLSMAAVARTQMVNISNIVRNQAMSWANIISNQVKRARDALTRQFMSMAAVARTQMSKVASAVSSSMSNVVASASRGISMNVNVNRSVSTGYSMPSANALYAANAGATFSLGNNMSAFANNASYAAPSGNSGGSSNSSSAGGSMVIEVPLYLDGREAARAIAKYVDGELKLMTKRENRKRGAK
jgi:TP901 family phage tail tape measure protein